LFQLLWNCVFIAAVGSLRRARIITGQAAIIAAATIVWFLSPFMYRLDDIPMSTSLLLTSYNPVSHVIAAYQNAYWYGVIPSPTILPAAALIVIAGIGLIWNFRTHRSRPHTVLRYAATPSSNPQIVIMGAASPPLTAIRADMSESPAAVFSRWQGRTKEIRGAGLVRLVLAARGLTRAKIPKALDDIKKASGLDILFEEDVGVYPDWAQDQLAFTLAMESSEHNLILDGLLNNVSPAFLATAWQRIEKDASQGRLISVIADRVLPLPAFTQASSRGLGSGGVS
jgi:hypothetical protein